MSDWNATSLGNLVSFQKGRKVDTSSYLLPNYQRYLGAGSLVGKYDGYASPYLAVQATAKDVLMLWDGERSGLVGHNLEGVVSSTVSKLTPNENITSDYLYYFLYLNFSWIQNRRTGTGVPHVPKDLKRMLVVEYPVEKTYQEKVTSILKNIDQTIEKTEALIAKYQLIKAGLMQDLFTRGIGVDGKLRPTREQAPELYQETEIGWIPKDWDVATLESITENLSDGPFGSNLKTEHYVNAPGVRVVRLQNISASNYNDEDRAFISEKHANFLIRNRVVENDVLIAGLGEERYPVGRACLYPKGLPPAVNKADCFRLRCNKDAVNGFIMYYLNTSLARLQISRYEQGVTRPRVNTGNLKKIPIIKPSNEEQKNIFERLLKIESKLEIEKSNSQKLQFQKQGLMHDLLTGKKRVTVNECEADHV